MRYMELSATAKVILGMLGSGPKSGYDIKSITDRSTRFFWAASYGQIYPELKRLAEAGLAEPTSDPQGGRQRTTYALTAAGRDALEAWTGSPGIHHELRDEGSLKVFFASLAGEEVFAQALREKRDFHQAELGRLREIIPFADQAGRKGPSDVLEYGIGLHEFASNWCSDKLKEVERET